MAMAIAGTYVMSSNVLYRESYEAAIQISMLTDELRDLPLDYSARMINTISDRTSSYYGYVVVPITISDKKVYDLMQYDNDNDKQYTTLLKKFDLDFAWFEPQGRHIMVWGKKNENVDTAIKAIKSWLCFVMSKYY